MYDRIIVILRRYMGYGIPQGVQTNSTRQAKGRTHRLLLYIYIYNEDDGANKKKEVGYSDYYVAVSVHH